MLMKAFDVFHDAAESMWSTLKALISQRGAGSAALAPTPPVDAFIACEEDRPIPVKVRLRKPLTLLDPDADILASFKP
jgi:hypothetical protein